MVYCLYTSSNAVRTVASFFELSKDSRTSLTFCCQLLPRDKFDMEKIIYIFYQSINKFWINYDISKMNWYQKTWYPTLLMALDFFSFSHHSRYYQWGFSELEPTQTYTFLLLVAMRITIYGLQSRSDQPQSLHFLVLDINEYYHHHLWFICSLLKYFYSVHYDNKIWNLQLSTKPVCPFW